MAHIFRCDPTNVGDWHSPPFKYFPLKSSRVIDISDDRINLDSHKFVIVGGGGLGRDGFNANLDLIRQNKEYTTIAWGVGTNTFTDRAAVLKQDQKFQMTDKFFEGFDEVGTREYLPSRKFRYVPCASCMSHLFHKYRNRRPSKTIGFYSHKRVPLLNKYRFGMFKGRHRPIITKHIQNASMEDNNGRNLEEKLEFLSDHEYIVSNTFHGVYWATLLNRKVISMPFKADAFYFKYPPVFGNENLDDELFDKAKNHPDSLDDCRINNIEFYKYLIDKYGDF
ncbi:MAG: polysaccharide pyruvyl transferase family protein [Pseudomonadota bacterium]